MKKEICIRSREFDARVLRLILLLILGMSFSIAQQSQGTVVCTVAEKEPALEPALDVRLVEFTTGSIVQALRIQPNVEFNIRNVPFGVYNLVVVADSITVGERRVEVRSTVPVRMTLTTEKEYRLEEVTVRGLTLPTTESPPRATYPASVLEKMPVVSANKRIESVLLNTAGVVPDEDGRMHMRGEHAQMQYVIDGIPITTDMSRVYSSLLNTQMVKSIDIYSGSLNAEYGVATSAVLAVTSKTGFDQPLFSTGSVEYGSFGQKEAVAEVGGNIRNSSAFYATGILSESDRYLDPISGFDPIHDHGQNGSAFGTFNTLLSPSVDLNVLGMYDHTVYDVPNSSVTSRQDQVQTLHDYLVGARFNAQLDARSMLSLVVYNRQTGATITSGGLSGISSPADSAQAVEQNEKFFIGGDRSLTQSGGQLEYSTQFDWLSVSHDLKAGIGGEIYPIHEYFTFAVTNPAVSDSSIPGGDIRYRAIDITQGGKPFLVDQSKQGSRASGYVQDAFRLNEWRFGVGVRFDDFNLFTNEFNVSPRVNVAYEWNPDLVLRASYNRIVMQAPLENILVSSSDEARTLAAGAQGNTPTRVGSELSHVLEVGALYRLNNFVDFDLAGYSKFIDNFLVNVELGNSGVIFPINLKKGLVAGGELIARLRDWNNLSGVLSFATSASLGLKPDDGSSPVAAGLILGEEGNSYSQPFGGESSFPTEHNQLITISMTLDYRLADDLSVVLGGRFDSGLPFDLTDKNGKGLDAQDSRTELERRGYSDAVIDLLSLTPDEPGSPDKSVAPHATFDLGIGYDMHADLNIPIRLSLTLLNVLDTEYLYKFESSFGGTHFGIPRTISLRVEAGL